MKNELTQTEGNMKTFQQGRLLGAIIGDIAGSMYERHKNNVFSYEEAVLFPKGKGARTRLTDDSVLTIAVARYLLENTVLTSMGLTEMLLRYAKEHPLDRKNRFGKPTKYAMYGKNFRKWIDNPAPYGAETNGSTMRVASVGWLCESLDQVMEVAKFTADVSHNSEAGEKGAQAIALCVFLARNGKTKDEIRAAVRELIGYDLDKDCDTLRRETEAYVHEHGHISALCVDSVPNAIQAFLESKDYEDAIRLAISMGGDSDTIACMCGAIAVAWYGEIPEWLEDKAIEKMEKTPDLIEVIKLLDEAAPKTFTIKEK